MKPNLILGDCAEKMRNLADNSIDAIVTDPPYGLNFMGMDFDNPKMMGLAMVVHGGLQRYPKGEKRTGYADCDNHKFQSYLTPIFSEALRVTKPGAHLLAFGGTRTYHRLACAIEDVGWEIRDCIMWVYGSGFPKSMDVSKAIDKMRGNSQRFQRMYADAVRKSGLNHSDIDRRLGIKSSSCYWVREDDRKSFQTKENWENLKTFLPLPDNADEIYEEAARKDREISDAGANMVFQPSQMVINPGTPATAEAAAWQGYGTCLKPAVEPIVVARKPLDGTIAANVLKYGTGAINIDACRVPTYAPIAIHSPARKTILESGHKDLGTWENNKGRFPANLVHDGSEEVLTLFPDSKGQCGAVKGNEPSELTRGIYGKFTGDRPPCSPRNDSGSAARFFYCAKASRAERGEGNVHPTVKPLALMRYLVRLVTRKGGTVLDPFMGSGTTGVAAIEEGMNFVGIERDPQYHEIAARRISAAKPEPPTTTQQELPL